MKDSLPDPGGAEATPAARSAGRSLLGAGLLLAFAMLLGRFTGFAREILLVDSFGLGLTTDVAVLLLTLPDMLVNLLLSGGIGVALIPEFRRLGKAEAGQLFLQALLVALAVFAVLALLILALGSPLAGILAPGMGEAGRQLFLQALPLLVWSLPLAAISGVGIAWANAREHFFRAAIGTLIINLTLIGALVLMRERPSLPMLVQAIVLAGVLRMGWQLMGGPWRQVGQLRLRPWFIGSPLLSRFFQAVLASALLLALPVVARALASVEGGGSIAMLNVATKLVELPQGVAVSVLAVILFPRLSSLYANQSSAEVDAVLRTGTRLTLLLGLCIAVPCVLYAPGLVDLLLSSSAAVDAAQRARVAELMQIGMLALPFMGWAAVLASALNAAGMTQAPLRVNAAALPFLVVSGWALGRHFGLHGVMAALSLTSVAVGLALAWQLRRLQGVDLMPWQASFWITSLAVVVACLLFRVVFPGATPWLALLQGGACGLLALVIACGFDPDCRDKWRAVARRGSS